MQQKEHFRVCVRFVVRWEGIRIFFLLCERNSKQMQPARQKISRLENAAAVRLRSKFHVQKDFTQDLLYRQRQWAEMTDEDRDNLNAKYSAAASVKFRLQQLASKVSTSDDVLGLADQARRVLQDMKCFSLAEDPKLILSAQILHLAAAFEVPNNTPGIEHLANLAARSTYMLDAPTAASLIDSFGSLAPQEMHRLLPVFAPRLEQLVPDLLPREAVNVAAQCEKVQTATVPLFNKLIKHIVCYRDTTHCLDLSRAVGIFSRVRSSMALQALDDVAPALQRKAHLLSLESVVQTFRAYGRVGHAPRRLVNALSSAVLQHIDELDSLQMSQVAISTVDVGCRHENLLKRLALRHIAMGTGTVSASAAFLYCFARFKIDDPDIVQECLQRLEGGTIPVDQAPRIIVACAQLAIDHPIVSRTLAVLASSSQFLIPVATLVAALRAVLTLIPRLHEPHRDVSLKALSTLVSCVCARGSEVVYSSLVDAVGECVAIIDKSPSLSSFAETLRHTFSIVY